VIHATDKDHPRLSTPRRHKADVAYPTPRMPPRVIQTSPHIIQRNALLLEGERGSLGDPAHAGRKPGEPGRGVGVILTFESRDGVGQTLVRVRLL
jgi:hypothetical protein